MSGGDLRGAAELQAPRPEEVTLGVTVEDGPGPALPDIPARRIVAARGAAEQDPVLLEVKDGIVSAQAAQGLADRFDDPSDDRIVPVLLPADVSET